MADESIPEFPFSPNDPDETGIWSEETFNMVWKSFTDQTLNNLASICPELDSTEVNQQLPMESNQQRDLQSDENLSTIQLPTQCSTVGTNVQSSSLPACETWPGQYDFTVSFSPQHKSTKGIAWTYSRIKDKLYVGKDAPCPVNFSANSLLPPDSYIRVMALYSSPEQVSEIVTRCVNHSMEEIKNGRVEAEHLIRCESTTATYHTDTSGRHSVLVPFENPPAGQQYSTYIYKFVCFGSCAGGPNRRRLMLIFSLEVGNRVVGRRKLDVKICACPGRDRKNEEAQCVSTEETKPPAVNPGKRKLAPESLDLSEIMDFTKSVYVPQLKKNKVSTNKDGAYILSIDDKECYDFLKQMKKLYEICKTMKSLPPDVLNACLHHMQKVKSEKHDT